MKSKGNGGRERILSLIKKTYGLARGRFGRKGFAIKFVPRGLAYADFDGAYNLDVQNVSGVKRLYYETASACYAILFDEAYAGVITMPKETTEESQASEPSARLARDAAAFWACGDPKIGDPWVIALEFLKASDIADRMKGNEWDARKCNFDGVIHTAYFNHDTAYSYEIGLDGAQAFILTYDYSRYYGKQKKRGA